VHLSGGLIEAHFAFFVAVVLLTLYEDWAVFGLAVAFVLLHHGVMGALRPHEVFHDPEQYHHPWRWAAIHAAFVAAAGVAGVIAWRLNENVRADTRETQTELAETAATDALTGLGNRRALLAALQRVADEARTCGTPAVLMLCDLDGFKHYNDSFGHQAGDALLARRSASAARASR
jgi:predicted signal transduction protein with EAL and GGDEF domain